MTFSAKNQYLEELEALESFIQHMPDSERKRRLQHSRTLVLNADYTPISILPLHTVSWKEAIVLVYQEKCKLLESYEDLVINSPRTSYRVPSILVNTRYVRPKRKVEYSPYNIFLRDNYQCQYCGEFAPGIKLTKDHWVPQAEGGKSTWENVTTACDKCNHKKQTQNQTRWQPRVKPYKPSFAELEAKARKRKIVIQDHRWIKYMDWLGEIHVNDGSKTYDLKPGEYNNYDEIEIPQE